jgi:TolB-like protein
MRLGIPETLLSDLRASGRVQVVEREQLERALAELALQEARGTEESTAARAGRLVGARTVLLGSFQRAGPRVRINARLVAVETGVVLGAAKVTGELERIFTLQDGLLARLLGPPDPAAPGRQRRTGPRLVKAYSLYGRALASASDAERVTLLREAVKEEPDFTYAREDLARLEARLREYRRTSEEALDARRSRLDALLADTSCTPAEREGAAHQLLLQHSAALRWWSLRRDAERLGHLTLPQPPSAALREHALASLATAHWKLRHREAALQATERFLREFPDSPSTVTMQVQARRLIAELRDIQAGRTRAALALAELEGPKPPPPGAQRRIRERRGCELRGEHFLLEEALATCRAFIESWRKDTDVEARRDVMIAWRMELTALAELGRFTEARARLEALEDYVAATPDLADQGHLVEAARASLPSDEEAAPRVARPTGP